MIAAIEPADTITAGDAAIACAWQSRAADLAEWSDKTLVNRRDAWGGYWPLHLRERLGKVTTSPPKNRRGLETLDISVFVRHYEGRNVGDVIGLHTTSPTDNTCRWICVEVDLHGDFDSDVAEKNFKAARHWYEVLVSLGFTAWLIDSNGKGGFHLWVFFSDPVGSAVAFAFAKWLVRDYKAHGLKDAPETFPKQESIDAESFGNWMRLPGHHHTRDHWSRFWNGSEWLEGATAVEFILATVPDPIELIPDAALPAEKAQPEPTHTAERDHAESDADRLSDEEVARRCIAKIPNGGRHYDEWLSIVAALHPGLRSEALAWSHKSDKHDEAKFDKTWSSFKRSNGTVATAGTLVHYAKEAGFDVWADRKRELREKYEREKREREKAGSAEQNTGKRATPDQWPNPVSLDAPAPPPLPDGIFRYVLGDMIRAVAESTEVPPDLPACFGTAAVSTVAQGKFSVLVKPDYFEPLNVWPVCSLGVANRKTENMRRMTAPLSELEDKLAGEMLPEIERLTSERKTIESRITRMRADAAKAKADDFARLMKEIEELEASLPDIPRVPQLFSQDVTPEHLGTMLADNDERLALISDEGGIFDIMGGRYSDGLPNLDVFLQAHAGAPVRVDRGSRPPVNLRHPSLVISLSPQPEVLRGLTAKRAMRGRGVLARIIYMMPASMMGYRTNGGGAVPADLVARYRDLIFALAAVPPDTKGDKRVPRVLYLSDAASGLWGGFWAATELQLRPDGRLNGTADWAGKLPGMVARMAGILHCADHGAGVVGANRIDGDTMQRAIWFGEYATAHALVAFDLMGADPAMETARALWKSIERMRQPLFTLRDAWLPVRAKCPTVADAEPGFDVLIDTGHIREPQQGDDEVPRKRGRPPSRRFEVNPKLTGGWS